MPQPPGPSQPPLAQLMHFTYRPLKFLDECAVRYGDTFLLRVAGLGDYLSISSPELIKQVFAGDPDAMHAGEANAVLKPILGQHSLLLLDGKPHARQRRLLMPPLHGERMRAYAEVMAEVTRRKLQSMPMGEAFSFHPHVQAITLEVILRTVFGVDSGAQLERLRQRLLDFLDLPPAIFTFIPVRYLDFPLSPYRAFMARRAAVNDELRALMHARRGSAATEGRTDVLSLLLSARDEEGNAMTDDELCDELMTLLLAGHETTATALSWTVAHVLADPKVLEKLDAELASAGATDGALDPGAVPRLEYLDAVIKEALRLRPIVPDVVRKLTAPMQFAGYELPAGVNLMPTIWLAHQRADTYPEPRAFRPERFVGAKVDPNAWLPFGGGVRRCIGMAFALYEMKVVLAQLLLAGRFRPGSTKFPHVVRRGITLAPSGGTRVVLAERRA